MKTFGPWEDSGDNRWEKVLAQAVEGTSPQIGVEASALPAIVRNWFDERLPRTGLTNVSGLLGSLRMIKSPEEIEVTRQAGEIALSEGAPEYEAALAVIAAGTRKAAGFLTDRGWDAFISPMIHNL